MTTPCILNLGDVPTLFISKSSKEEKILFGLIGNTIDSGEVFFEFLPTDIWGTIEKTNEYYLFLKRDNNVLLKCKVPKSSLPLIEDKRGIVLILSNNSHSFKKSENISSLRGLEKWIREEENRIKLDEGEIGVVLIGVWKDKPF